MDELMGMIINDESPSDISSKIKEILQVKAMEKIEATRPEVATSLFDGNFSSEED